MEAKTIAVRLEGARPIMFDRYPGDNKTQLPTQDKMYLDAKQGLLVPALNVFSMLVAENTKSVCRQFMGKNGKTIGLAIGGNLDIQPFDIPLLGKGDKQIRWTGDWTEQIHVRSDVARVNKGIPNPKERPVVELPWALEFRAEWIVNDDVSVELLRQVFELSRKIGLGTFRPFFGAFRVARFEVK